MITNFLSNRTNLTILQLILSFFIAYTMGSHLELGELIIVYISILGLVFITHIKGVADGMVYNQMMNGSKDFKKFIEKIKNNKLGE